MADNVPLPAAAGSAAADEATWSGDTVKVPLTKLVFVTGSEGSKTIAELPGDTGNGLDVDVTRLPALVAGTANIGDVDVLTVPADPFGVNADAASATGSISAKLRFIAATGIPITGNVASIGDVAHDSADSGAPQKMGAKATASVAGLTLVAAADRTDLFAGTDGVQIVRPYCSLEDIVTGAPAGNTSGASFEVIAAGAAGIKHYLTQVVIINTSTASIYCDILDGATVKTRIPVPAQGGATVSFPVPIPGTAATAWNCDPSAATTTVYCSMVAFKSKV